MRLVNRGVVAMLIFPPWMCDSHEAMKLRRPGDRTMLEDVSFYSQQKWVPRGKFQSSWDDLYIVAKDCPIPLDANAYFSSTRF